MANFFKENTKKSLQTQVKQKLTVKIEKLDLNGCGVAYYKNKPVFVNGSLPNESVDIQIIEQKNKYALGKLLTINTANESRITPKCQHFSLCGGCDLQHLEYFEQLAFKQHKVVELLSRSGIATNTIAALPWQKPLTDLPWHYRRKARIGVQFNKNAQPILGFRQKATNQLIAIKSCPVLVKPANDIFPILKELLTKLSVKKSIGHIEVIGSEISNIESSNIESPNTVNSTPLSSKLTSSKLTLVVRQIREINEHDRQLWHEYASKNHWNICFQSNASDESNSKENHNHEHESANNNLNYNVVDDIQINFSITDFIQINQQVNYAMVAQALTWLKPKSNDQILDLFCGLGNFSLPLARKVAKVVGVEGVQSMVDKASANARDNHIDNCSFFQADLNSEWLSNKESTHWSKHKFNKVLLDPARAGAELAVKQLVKLGIETVLYISCEPTTLARDSQFLLEKGYKIEKIGLIDMFSQTKHVETMVLFKLYPSDLKMLVQDC